MSTDVKVVSPELTYDRIVAWLNRSDYKDTVSYIDTDLVEGLTDITSVTRNFSPDDEYFKEMMKSLKPKAKAEDYPTEMIWCPNEVLHTVDAPSPSMDSISKFMQKLKSNTVIKFAKISPWTRPTSKLMVSEPTLNEEIDSPETNENCKNIPSSRECTTEMISTMSTPLTRNRHSLKTLFKRQLSARPKQNRKLQAILISFWESTVVCLMLLMLDVLINPEEYTM